MDDRKSQTKKRRREKFIRKVNCRVCGDVANDHLHYGGVACYSCRAFFRRAVNQRQHETYVCKSPRGGEKCVINVSTRKLCQRCRYEKCLEVRMLPKWVLSDEEKREKKKVLMVKMKERRNLNSSRGGNGSRKGVKKESPRIKDDDESDDGIEVEEVYRAGLSEEEEEEIARKKFRLERISRPNFWSDEFRILCDLSAKEEFSRVSIQLLPETVLAMKQSALSGLTMNQDALNNGYNVCRLRMEHFVNQIPAFSALDPADRNLLLSSNLESVVNFKAARMLIPTNGLQRQLACAVGTGSPAAVASSNYGLVPLYNRMRINYSQVFNSPWCCDEQQEEQFKLMMNELYSIAGEAMRDETTTMLLSLTILLSAFPKEELFKYPDAIHRLRNNFLNLLFSHLNNLMGQNQAQEAYRKYQRMQVYLDEMSRILRNERLLL